MEYEQVKKIDMNKVALFVAKREAGKREVNIAQIKEILSIYTNYLANICKDYEVLILLKRYRK